MLGARRSALGARPPPPPSAEGRVAPSAEVLHLDREADVDVRFVGRRGPVPFGLLVVVTEHHPDRARTARVPGHVHGECETQRCPVVVLVEICHGHAGHAADGVEHPVRVGFRFDLFRDVDDVGRIGGVGELDRPVVGLPRGQLEGQTRRVRRLRAETVRILNDCGLGRAAAGWCQGQCDARDELLFTAVPGFRGVVARAEDHESCEREGESETVSSAGHCSPPCVGNVEVGQLGCAAPRRAMPNGTRSRRTTSRPGSSTNSLYRLK